jgi:Spy/CpxP family protein refolding chaperone
MLAVAALTTHALAADTAKTTPISAPDEAKALEQFRNDLQAKSADLMAKGLTLTADQAAKFWPLFETFQKEQSAIVDGQLQATHIYTDRQEHLTDAEALKYINALLERDAKIHDLREKWLDKFQTVVPPKVAARAIQIDRRLGLTTQIALSSQIPLIE